MKYKALIFDIDGTLLNTESSVLVSLQHALYRTTKKLYKFEELYFALGIPGKDALKKLGFSSIEGESIIATWDNYYEQYSYMTSSFVGMDDTLKKLSSEKIDLGIVTSKTREEYIRDFEIYPISKYFSVSICADDTILHKPNPDPLLAALKILGVNPFEAIYIGDSCYDMECASKANVASALALWGCHSPDGIDAMWKLSNPSEILSILE